MAHTPVRTLICTAVDGWPFGVVSPRSEHAAVATGSAVSSTDIRAVIPTDTRTDTRATVPATRKPPSPGAAVPPAADGPWLPWLLPSLLTALAYLLAGKLSLLLAIPPGVASPLYPGAGLALAAVLVYGGRAVPGVALGAYLVNSPLGALHAVADLQTGLLPLVIALGAALQALLGATLVRRRRPGPVALVEPRDVVAFCLLGGVLACMLNATLSTLVLSAAGVVPRAARAFTWWTWWGGDTLGVLIGAPITLTLIGRPRADWQARRITLGLPLLVATALLAAGTVLVTRWDTQRARTVFERDANAAAASLQADLQQPLYALEALHGLFIGSGSVSPQEMRRVAQPWLALPVQVQALGYSERVARSDVARFNAATATLLQRPYAVFDRPGGASASAPLRAGDSDVMAIRFIEPSATNAAALGLNVLSVPAASQAIRQATFSDAPAATAGFRLTQETGDQTGVVIYRALYAGEPALSARAAALRGVVFVSLRLQSSVAAGLRDAPRYLAWCLVDRQPQAVRRRLAGTAGCELAAPGALHHETGVQIGGQQWLLRIDASLGQVPDAGYANAWLFSTVGLLSAGMLAALLLTVTGRTRRIEAAVAERTADLQREVAERQRTESALSESEQRFRNIFDHAPIGILYADLAGRVRDANPKLREMVGYGPDELAQHTIGDLAHDDDRAELALGLGCLLRGELPEVHSRSRLRHRDGQTLWVRMNWRVLRGPDGQQQRLVAVIEDITEQLRREDAEQGRQLAESANQAKNDFLSRMSHELRTPLNAMLGFGQLLDLDQRPRLANHQLGWVAHVLRAGWPLLEMINDMLDLSRIDAGMLKLTPVPIDLAPLVAHCISMVEPAAVAGGITLRVHIGAATPPVLGDATRLKQVMSNLLSNAVKYNTRGGSVAVHARALAGQRLEIRVHDTGLGLSPAQMAELFQPFNRLGRESSDTEGTGIGLVISRRLAELMGGELHAESTEGQGATFVLTLPLAAGRDDAPAGSPAGEDAGLRYRHRWVHYVEDNETNVEVMRGMLLQRPQVSLAVSTLGLDGLVAIRTQRPDLILLDMHLPDVDGLELLRQLQRDPLCADIPVVVVSADATPAGIEQALAAGARHYLTKPVNLAGLLAVLDELLEGMDTQFG